MQMQGAGRGSGARGPTNYQYSWSRYTITRSIYILHTLHSRGETLTPATPAVQGASPIAIGPVVTFIERLLYAGPKPRGRALMRPAGCLRPGASLLRSGDL